MSSPEKPTASAVGQVTVHLGRTYEFLRDAGLTPRGARTRPDAADPATPAPGDTD
ncbi:MAG: hypothetical protein ACK4GP_01690 [Deinococcus sp.]